MSQPCIKEESVFVRKELYPVPYKCNTKVDEGYCKKIADGFQYAYNILFRENKYDENASGVCVIDHDNKVVKFTDNAVGTTNDLICGGENNLNYPFAMLANGYKCKPSSTTKTFSFKDCDPDFTDPKTGACSENKRLRCEMACNFEKTCKYAMYNSETKTCTLQSECTGTVPEDNTELLHTPSNLHLYNSKVILLPSNYNRCGKDDHKIEKTITSCNGNENCRNMCAAKCLEDELPTDSFEVNTEAKLCYCDRENAHCLDTRASKRMTTSTSGTT